MGGLFKSVLLFYETEKYANKYRGYIAFIITTITCKMIRCTCREDESKERDWFGYSRQINFARLLFIIRSLYKEISMHIKYTFYVYRHMAVYRCQSWRGRLKLLIFCHPFENENTYHISVFCYRISINNS